MTQNIIANGKKDKISHIEPAEKILQTKPIKIFIRIWPAIILANKRIDRLKIREKYETYSIRISNGIINNGTPSGKNNTKYFSLWYKTPIIFVPMKKANE